MYGSESCVWQKKNESRINAVEMRSLRNMCGVFLKDRCKNNKSNNVREQCALKENVVTRKEEGMLLWCGHLKRINESRLTKQICRANVHGRKAGKGALENPSQTILMA
ncbi:hypothetical protein EVAR_95848_1 [Eumeta japonica]|uniref:Uncharacterized protein n=1 Tax=Eumeta variegata TaxID=151549 RepID=A0A4C1VK86_EUMVA|nr:hypothetical protein EVAR_95848_1 [Eumeta japonica]